ncbi:UvrD-helicase domain-containing protein [Streptomyces sp. NPDC017413]|uniref:UvrD-helicase domain-containing protein n=1 Tax=Streptomyces sp. NPDC017413 TaxID=3364994 RepID=UPI0037A841A4
MLTAITITSEFSGSFLAKGATDDLAAQLLRHAGCKQIEDWRGRRHRLPTTTPLAEQVAIAGHAAEMLRAARYDVTLPPSLDTARMSPPVHALGPYAAGAKGSAKVTGEPGTGKTVVALHRVRYLVDRLPPGQTRPVLLTTYNTNLAADLRERLHRLGGDALVRRVDVKSVDQVAREVVEQHPGSVLGTPMGDEEAMALWHRACTEMGVFDYDADVLDAEFKHVILAQGCGTERLCFRAERKGRGVLQRADRKKAWKPVQTYRSLLDGPPRRTTYALIADEAARIEGRHTAKAVEQARYKEEHGGLDLVHREAGSGMWLKPRYRHSACEVIGNASTISTGSRRRPVPCGKGVVCSTVLTSE